LSRPELFWIATAWPSGAQAIVFAAIAAIVFSPKADQAYTTTISFMVGTRLAAGLAAIVKFAVLPDLSTFAGFSLAMGLFLVPTGALMVQSQAPMFIAMIVTFVPLLAPATDAGGQTAALPLPPGATREQVALGDRIFHGEESDGTCSGCHGSDAGGTSVGPLSTTAGCRPTAVWRQLPTSLTPA